jgi:hypothetical protein
MRIDCRTANDAARRYRRLLHTFTKEMNTADFNELSESEKRHFYKCSRCGEMVDRRQLDDVLFHETDHKPRPDINTAGRSELKNEPHASVPTQFTLPECRIIRHNPRWVSVYEHHC